MAPFLVLFKDIRNVFKMDELGSEIIQIALPAALALAADPVASLIDTAFIGHIGPVELAAVGVSIAIFNQASRITIFPLVSITTSFVAEEDAINNITPKLEDQSSLNKLEQGDKAAKDDQTQISKDVGTSENKKQHIPSASTAIIIGMFLGLFQVLLLVFGANTLLGFMGSPAVLLSLAMQGVFRGFKDTKTPLFATRDVSNIILDPILIFVCHMGVGGAAIAHVFDVFDALMETNEES
ncbi:hypothetical protein V2J09_012179 [Rumex salicifolius]